MSDFLDCFYKDVFAQGRKPMLLVEKVGCAEPSLHQAELSWISQPFLAEDTLWVLHLPGGPSLNFLCIHIFLVLESLVVLEEFHAGEEPE